MDSMELANIRQFQLLLSELELNCKNGIDHSSGMCRVPPNWSTVLTQPQNSRGPRLMYEEFCIPMLYQLACAPNCYEFGFLQPLFRRWGL